MKLEGDECYAAMPVIQANSKHLPMNSKIHFLSPLDRLVSPTSNTVPCSDRFGLKYKTIKGGWIAYSLNGIIKAKSPQSKNSFSDDFYFVPVYFNDSIKFEEGIYSYEKIRRYENLPIFNSARESKMTKVISNVPLEKIYGGSKMEIEPEDLFKFYPFDQIKQKVLSGLVTFGNWVSVIIGIVGCLQIIKAIVSTIFGCAKAKEVTTSRKDLLSLVFNPLSFVVDRMKQEQEMKNKNPELVLQELQKLNKTTNATPAASGSNVRYPDLN